MNIPDIIQQGNDARAVYDPHTAIACYAQAFVADSTCSAAFNNYGNVLREMGYPDRAIPFLEHACILDPSSITAKFNLSVAELMRGNWEKGWQLYESRWNYEHLSDTKPKLAKPEWTGQDINGKTVLIIGEQGLGDQIQFARFMIDLHQKGAKIRLHVTYSIKELFSSASNIVESVTSDDEEIGEYDYWVPIMSLPKVLGLTLENYKSYLQYLLPDPTKVAGWATLLGAKKKMRIGFAWSGRRDSWIHQHKSIPVQVIADLIQKNPQHQWINLQVDATPEEEAIIKQAGADCFPGTIAGFGDTAGLLANLDLVISVDTAVAHLAGAMGRPTWIPLNAYGACWRWLTNRDDCPWYPSVRLFRQQEYGNWTSSFDKIHQYLGWFKV
jgi:ADP-heptose:LPS heptosyltransferase